MASSGTHPCPGAVLAQKFWGHCPISPSSPRPFYLFSETEKTLYRPTLFQLAFESGEGQQVNLMSCCVPIAIKSHKLSKIAPKFRFWAAKFRAEGAPNFINLGHLQTWQSLVKISQGTSEIRRREKRNNSSKTEWQAARIAGGRP